MDVRLNDPGIFSSEARFRFEKYFGPTNQYAEINGHILVFVDSPRLIEEDRQRRSAGVSLQRFAQSSDEADSAIVFIHRVSQRIGTRYFYSLLGCSV